MSIDISRHWYRPSLNLFTFLLLPVSWLFGLCCSIRRYLYKLGIIKSKSFSVPIIVVGNVTVGGTGKTPLVIWLANFFQSQGYRPGIVSRGVGGRKHRSPIHVQSNSSASDVGDEALLLVKKTNCPVFIGIDRVAAVNELLKNFSCDIVLSDDGLQHYRLKRNIEIAVVDGMRRFGNAHLLPAGPLREPVSRLKQVDFVVVNGEPKANELNMMLEPQAFILIKEMNKKINCDQFTHKKIHAVAATGNPERFFLSLKKMGFDIVPHSFPDHYLFQLSDFNFVETYPIVMTEKDAVKCQSFADDRYWYLSVDAKMDEQFVEGFKKIIYKKIKLEAGHEN